MRSAFAHLLAGFLIAPFGVASCFVTPAHSAGDVPQLTPYRVIYDIDLSDDSMSLSKPAAVSALNGRMVFEFRGNACEGYATTQRLVTSTQMSEGPTALEDVQLASFEQPGGRGFEFFKRSLLNQRAQRSPRGSATRSEAGIQIDMSQPSKMEFELPDTVLFPSAYVKAMIAAAEAGERVFTAYIFDGSDSPGEYFQVSTSIGTAFIGDETRVPHSALNGVKGWPVTLAYYPSSQKTEGMIPLYEVNTEVFANGISGNMQFGFGDYTLDFSISELEVLPSSDCDK